ncbi:hypothetical protein D9757_008695 [Collybiopsis confluens]|uniref:Uncharacterized protein n=1 Tax=Collybiopsis confluens TaxID=2823264 RepID=A0A8H5M0R4_9AGAR|nr:hypothetical protein D9757_008695 [Collybiopsis confluens]
MKEHLPTGISVSSGNLEDLPSLPRDMMQRRDLSVKSVKMQRHDGDRSLRSSIQECYLEILSLFFLAVLVSCMNHVLFAHFDGQEPGSHTSQFWVTVLKNMFPAAVAFLLFMGLKICLSQVALYHIQLSSHPIGVVNFMTSPPGLLNILSTLLKSSMHASILSFALLTAITQAVALTSLFVPFPLSTLTLSARRKSVIDVARTGDDDQLGISTSQRWQQLIQRAASSNSAPGWNPPAGCGSTIKQDIWPSKVNTSDSLLTLSPTSGTFFNSTPTFAYTSSEKGSPFNRA